MALGSPLPTSSAWVGPQSTTTGQLASSSSPTASLSRLEVPSSIPLATLTTTVPGFTILQSFRAVVRTAKEGVASTTASQSAAAVIS